MTRYCCPSFKGAIARSIIQSVKDEYQIAAVIWRMKINCCPFCGKSLLGDGGK